MFTGALASLGMFDHFGTLIDVAVTLHVLLGMCSFVLVFPMLTTSTDIKSSFEGLPVCPITNPLEMSL